MKETFVIFCTFTPILLSAQNRLSEHNGIGWYSIFVTPKISDKVSGHIEYQWRRTNFITGWQQNMPRIGINYKLTSQITVQAGYAWIQTFPYGKYSIAAIPKTFPEHRVYEQVTITAPVGKATLAHRLRLEQRWIGKLNSIDSKGPDEWVFLNRLRYMPRLDIPLDKKLYVAAYDEILIGFGKNLGENVFDQNRAAFMAGYKFTPQIRMEAGFLSQILQLGREIDNKNVFQYNNGLLISAYFNLN